MGGLIGLMSEHSGGYNRKVYEKVKDTVSQLGETRKVKLLTTHDEHSLNTAVEQVFSAKPEYLLISGGDGSLLFYLKKLLNDFEQRGKHYDAFENLPPIIYLALGTENKMAQELGKEKPIRYLERIVDDIKNNRHITKKKFDLMGVKVDDDSKKIYTFDVGLGLALNFLLTYYGMRKEDVRKGDDFRNTGYKPNSIDAFFTIGQYIALAPFYNEDFAKELYGRVRGKLYIEGEKLEVDDFLTLFASTTKILAKGFRPFYNATVEGKAQLIATWKTPFELVFQVPNIWRGKPIKGKTIDKAVSNFKMELYEPTIAQIGGEFWKVDKEINVDVKKSIDFIV